MKFARFLEETQTPEWKKAYIDYRGLKKRITAIRKAQQTGSQDNVRLSSDEDDDVADGEHSMSETGHDACMNTPPTTHVHRGYGSTGTTPPLQSASSALPPHLSLPPPALELNKSNEGDMPSPSTPYPRHKNIRTFSENILTQRRADSSLAHETDRPTFVENQSPRFLSSLAGIRRRTSIRSHTTFRSNQELPLAVLLPGLSPIQRQFFEKLDKELAKVEDFYTARESEAKVMLSTLREQLHELKEHRQVFHAAHTRPHMLGVIPIPHVIADHVSIFPKSANESNSDTVVSSSVKGKSAGIYERPEGRQGLAHNVVLKSITQRDPFEYKQAKKHLKKALAEYYRGLELLSNYRVLNLTGFRKALKKFEKVTKIPVQNVYMREKVEVAPFASGDVIDVMLKEAEALYAARFERGDMKKARSRLRAFTRQKSHHYSTFRTGLFIGTSLPVLVWGIVESFQPGTRAQIPWDALLYIYASLFIPVLLALFVGLNILVWKESRINYGFIFDLNVKEQLDSREYFELPSFLFCTLCYAFWLSFSRLGTSSIAPTTWPLIWIVFAVVVMLNPLPILYPRARWWITRKVSKLFASGTRPVEFTDFWLGDQFCSLSFTLGNIFLIGCAYETGWPRNTLSRCGVQHYWGVPFALASLPLLVRTVQSIKRYYDSRLNTHLVNAGKYTTNMIYYAAYYIWRRHGMPHNYLLAIYCLAGVAYSTYTATWDILMDWSFFKRPARYPLLRQELVYSHIFTYYFAIISNILLRFVWIIYIPSGGASIQLRTFIAAVLEVLRRWQWNFFRLENEHIGNTDQYRVTREVPLPYTFDEADNDSDGGDEDDEHYDSSNSWRRRPSVRMTPFTAANSQRQQEEP